MRRAGVLSRGKSKVYVLLMAAGRGRRAGLPVNKAFYRYRGRTVLERALESLLLSRRIDGVVLVLAESDRHRAAALLRIFPRLFAVVSGGRERADSVRKGLAALAGKAKSGDLVLIHDAARPFLPVRVVRDLLKAVSPGKGAVPGLAVADTLKRTAGGRVLATLDRRGVFGIQTPQAFRYEDILSAYERSFGKKTPTDDAEFFERTGGRVAVVAGSVFLFKITWPEDLRLYRMMVDEDVQNRLRR